MYLQSYIVSVVLYEHKEQGVNVLEVIGTGFFINTEGYFLTAAHVISAAHKKAKEKKLQIGIVVKGENGKSPKSYISPLLTTENAPAPYDIALGHIDYKLEAQCLLLTFKQMDIEVWQRVATCGYPLNAISGDPANIKINLRAHKGIVQRILAPGDVAIVDNPAAYELSFLIGTGISGSPLFIANNPKDIVIGVCVASSRSEEVDEIVEISEEGKTYRETKMSITEFGIAHDVMSLWEWKPKLLDGKKFSEIV